ncbi:MAG: hypothetical protein WAU68_09200 [Vitreimonas sp.]
MWNLINRGAARFVAAIAAFLATVIFIDSANPIGFVLVFAGPILVVAIHEAGHALAAWLLGMNVIEISVGPLALYTRPVRLGLTRTVLGYDVGDPR